MSWCGAAGGARLERPHSERPHPGLRSRGAPSGMDPWCGTRFAFKAVSSRGHAEREVAMRFSTHCVMFGHDYRMVRDRARLFLRCEECRHETPGWPLTSEHPLDSSQRVPVTGRALRAPIVAATR